MEAGGNLEIPNCSEAKAISIQDANGNADIFYSRPLYKAIVTIRVAIYTRGRSKEDNIFLHPVRAY